jgi:hypothetical protein
LQLDGGANGLVLDPAQFFGAEPALIPIRIRLLQSLGPE